MSELIKQGDLVRISERIARSWRDGKQWGSIAFVVKIEGMVITLLCDTGFVRELPVQLSTQYLSIINETR